MLFGRRDTFGIEIQPLAPAWERRYAPERTGWARFALWVRNVNLCGHVVEDSDSVENAVNIPLAALSDWLVQSWPYLQFEERAALFATSDDPYVSADRWGESRPSVGIPEDDWFDRREEWWARHFLVAGAEGAFVPDIAFVRQHDQVVVQWRPRFPGARDRRVLAGAGKASLDWSETAVALGDFVQYVADWLRRDGEGALYPWVARQDPLREIETPVLAALELFTAKSTDELQRITGARTPAQLPSLLGLPDDAHDPAASPITQALRDLPSALPPVAGELLRDLDAQTRTAPAAEPAVVSVRQEAQDAIRGALSLESAGYASAEAARRSLGLDGAPIGNVRALIEDLGIRLRFENLRMPGTRMIVGYRRDGVPAATVLRSQPTEVEWGQRFEAVRALGHLALDAWRSDALGAGSSNASDGRRRRRSGAFAAEFLLPEQALLQETGGALDAAADPAVFKHLLETFGVGATTAAYHLWNRGLLSSEVVCQQLIDDFGAA